MFKLWAKNKGWLYDESINRHWNNIISMYRIFTLIFYYNDFFTGNSTGDLIIFRSRTRWSGIWSHHHIVSFSNHNIAFKSWKKKREWPHNTQTNDFLNHFKLVLWKTQLVIHIYCKFSNKCAGHGSKEITKKRAFAASRGFLQNENWTIFGWDMAKNVKFWVRVPLRKQGAPLLGEAPLLENLR